MPQKRRLLALAGLILLLACQPSNGPATRPPREQSEATPARGSRRPWFRRACALPARYLELIRRGHYAGRSPELAVVPRAPNFFGSFATTTHSGPWAYLQEVPLVLFGPGFIRPRGTIAPPREVTLADLAPTLADLLGVSLVGDRPGRSIAEALVPAEERPHAPRMILVVVWDGGGWNVLRRWPEAWPFLDRLMRRGTSISNARVGSSPSVTPAVHATLGTGAWPNRHGIVDLQLRESSRVLGSFEGQDPSDLELETLADVYDPATENRAKVGMLAEREWHMGMIGHGSRIEGGDKDILALGDGAGSSLYTNERWFSLPDYLDEVGGLERDILNVDLEDGRADQTWVGHRILGRPEELSKTPVQTLYQTRQLTTLFARERYGRDAIPDLFYTNFKQVDIAGHVYNMVNPEMRSSLEHADRSLRRLTAFLDGWVGEKRWVLAVTADHGQGPDPATVGAWPIDAEELVQDVSAHFGARPGEIIERTRVTGFWLNRAGMRAQGLGVGELADWLNDYRLRDNAVLDEVPEQYRSRLREKLFAATFPASSLPRLLDCARE